MAQMIRTIILCMVILLSIGVCANGNEKFSDTSAEDTLKTKIMENIGVGKKVYLAGPLFNQAEKDFNLKITKVLEHNGYQVFLPQRDGIEAAVLQGKTEEELVRMIFGLDAGEVEKADIIFMMSGSKAPIPSDI